MKRGRKARRRKGRGGREGEEGKGRKGGEGGEEWERVYRKTVRREGDRVRKVERGRERSRGRV